MLALSEVLEAEPPAPLEMPLEQAGALGGCLHRGNAAGVLLGEPGRENPERACFRECERVQNAPRAGEPPGTVVPASEPAQALLGTFQAGFTALFWMW